MGTPDDDQLAAAFRRWERKVATGDDVLIAFVLMPLATVIMVVLGSAIWAALT